MTDHTDPFGIPQTPDRGYSWCGHCDCEKESCDCERGGSGNWFVPIFLASVLLLLICIFGL